MSHVTTSTVGGVNYDLLIKGMCQSYSHNLIDLCPRQQPVSFQTAEDLLVSKINDILTDISIQQPDKEIEAFTIGKSHVVQKRKRNRGFVKFDRMDPQTWKLGDGVNGRWRNEYKANGYNGLVVLVAASRDVCPSNICHRDVIDQEMYALGLEQRLIQHFMLVNPDPRCQNKSFHPGNRCDTRPYAGIVYLAYKLKTSSETELGQPSIEISNQPSIEVLNQPSIEVLNQPSIEVLNQPGIEVLSSSALPVRETALIGNLQSAEYLESSALPATNSVSSWLSTITLSDSLLPNEHTTLISDPPSCSRSLDNHDESISTMSTVDARVDDSVTVMLPNSVPNDQTTLTTLSPVMSTPTCSNSNNLKDRGVDERPTLPETDVDIAEASCPVVQAGVLTSDMSLLRNNESNSDENSASSDVDVEILTQTKRENSIIVLDDDFEDECQHPTKAPSTLPITVEDQVLIEESLNDNEIKRSPKRRRQPCTGDVEKTPKPRKTRKKTFTQKRFNVPGNVHVKVKCGTSKQIVYNSSSKGQKKIVLNIKC